MAMHLASLHTLAVEKLTKRRPEQLSTKGLAVFLRGLSTKFDMFLGEEDILRRIPDAWAYVPHETDEYPGTLLLFEIEDSHALTSEKMWDYADAADTYDFYDLDTRLFVYDRYCEQEREIDLREYWFSYMEQAARAQG